MYTKKSTIILLALVLSTISFQSCQISQEEEIEHNLENQLDELKHTLKEVEKQFDTREKPEIVNFRELKELFPSRVSGIKRSDDVGETTSALGFTLSTAKAEYDGGDGEFISIKITDIAGVKAVRLALAAWSTTSIDKEWDSGHERTFLYDGDPAYEKFDKRRDEGQFILLANERYLIEIKGKNVPWRDLKNAIKKMDYEDLP